MRATLALVLVLVGPACSCEDESSAGPAADSGAPDAPAADGVEPPDAGPDGPPPGACADRDPQKRPLFGDLHVHTAWSFDSALALNENDPEAAYRFARGEEVELFGGRPFQLDRPLDFAAVTDHSEFLGEVSICLDEDATGYNSLACIAFRNERGNPALGQIVFGAWAADLMAQDPERMLFCGAGGANCLDAAADVWSREQEAAAGAYDECSFTTFVAYEWTATTGGANLHRNVIFRNDKVPPLPISYYETPTAEELWAGLRAECLDAGRGCDVLAIPHNSNLGNGRMFALETSAGEPLTAGWAAERASMEPLVEIMQHKGDSECQNGFADDPSEPDEYCGFEKVETPCTGSPDDPAGCSDVCPGGAGGCASPLDYVRAALVEGLAQEETLGVNPFKLGVIASTDTHNATPGATEESAFQGHLGAVDDTPEEQLGDLLRFGPGGLAVVWAEENTREAIFAGLRRRETYGTSGTRPVVRFFGGWSLAGDLCGDPKLVSRAYAAGVPMGADLPARGGDAPTLLVWAARDPGAETRPSAPLDRVQVVKGWVDGDGGHARVFDVACAGGEPDAGGRCPATAATVAEDCTLIGGGADELCAAWTDPDFDPGERAYYYVRVIENPSCRWHAHMCNSLAVDCKDPGDYAACCDATIPWTVQERAWTSPIWYVPK